MKKFIHIVSMAVLGMILLNGFVRVDAASRTVAINMANNGNTLSSQMLASNLYPIDYMIVAGDTSRGDIDYKITKKSISESYTIVAASGACSVGATLATTGFGGAISPITINVDSYIRIELSKGTKRNNSEYYIGSGLVYTPTEDVLGRDAGRLSMTVMGEKGQIDLGVCHAEMNRLADEMKERVNEWDEQNAVLME